MKVLLACAALAACSDDATRSPADGPSSTSDAAPDSAFDAAPDGPPIMVAITVEIIGDGRVTSPAGIDCGSQCTIEVAQGSSLALAAHRGRDAHESWTAECAGQGAACTLVATADTTIIATFAPLACSADAICWEAPLPFGSDLNDVYAIGANDVWAVGNRGAIVHFDGTRWTTAASPTTNDLINVWGRSANDVWAAAGYTLVDHGTALLLHFDGTSWQTVDTGQSGKATGVFAGATQVFASTNTRYVLHSSNGVAWTPVDSQIANASLHVTGRPATDDVWVFGSNGVSRWNGATYTPVSRPDPFSASAIWVPRNNEAWAITDQSNVFHDFGSSFLAEGHVVMNGGNAFHTLFGFGVATDDMFTSGFHQLYHFDGTSWLPSMFVHDIQGFDGIHGVASNDVWAVAQHGALAHWDGTAAELRRRDYIDRQYTGLWGTGPDNMWFSTTDTDGIVGKTVVHWDGVTFRESQPLTMPTGDLGAIAGTAPNDIWVAGRIDNLSPVALRFDGTMWKPTAPSIAIGNLQAIAPDDVWGIGVDVQSATHWDGTSWVEQFPNIGYISSLWAHATNDVWIGGFNKLAHYTGTWSVRSIPIGQIVGIGGTSADDMWLGTRDGVYHMVSGVVGPKLPIADAFDVLSILAVATDDVWFADREGLVFRWRGTTIERVDTGAGTRTRLRMFANAANDVWFAGQGVLRYRP